MRKRLTPEDFRRIESMLAAGAKYKAIEKAVGWSRETIRKIASGELERAPEPMPSVIDVLGSKGTTPGDPTQEEIAEACAKLRQYRPRPGVADRWSLPTIRVATPGGAA